MSDTGFCFPLWVLLRNVQHLGAAVAALALGLDLAATAAEPLEIGGARQVFIDGRFLAETQNVTLEVHVPRKTGDGIGLGFRHHPPAKDDLAKTAQEIRSALK